MQLNWIKKGVGNDIYVQYSRWNYIYKKQIFESISAKDMERVEDIYIMQPNFLIYQLLR